MIHHINPGEVQGLLEQLATLAVIGGYPGSILFGFFLKQSPPWTGPQFVLALAYSLIAAFLIRISVMQGKCDGGGLVGCDDDLMHEKRENFKDNSSQDRSLLIAGANSSSSTSSESDNNDAAIPGGF